MRWEALTSPDFAKAVKETGVCVLPMGVLEKHGEQCPLGTDSLIAHAVATQAAEVEPAVVFPRFDLGQINEARCYPGTVAISLGLLSDLMEAVLDEIGRNGFRKVLIYSWHGGNPNLIGMLLKRHLEREKPYSLYAMRAYETPERREARVKLLESFSGGHGGEYETSLLLALYPEMVRMEAIAESPAHPLKRLAHLAGLETPMGWYGSYPEHYSGDAHSSTAEKGRLFMRPLVETLVDYIRAVKADEVEPALQAEFFRREGELRKS